MLSAMNRALSAVVTVSSLLITAFKFFVVVLGQEADDVVVLMDDICLTQTATQLHQSVQRSQ
jgi:hypothetical protein